MSFKDLKEHLLKQNYSKSNREIPVGNGKIGSEPYYDAETIFGTRGDVGTPTGFAEFIQGDNNKIETNPIRQVLSPVVAGQKRPTNIPENKIIFELNSLKESGELVRSGKTYKHMGRLLEEVILDGKTYVYMEGQDVWFKTEAIEECPLYEYERVVQSSEEGSDLIDLDKARASLEPHIKDQQTDTLWKDSVIKDFTNEDQGM